MFIHLHGTERVHALDPLLDHYESDLPIFVRKNYSDVIFLKQKLELPLPNLAFEAIYCLNAINHVADWGAALDTLTAAATTGTRLLLSSDVHRNRLLLPVFRALPGDALHPQQHRAEDYRAALTARHWRIEREVVLRREAIFDYTAWVAVYAPPLATAR